MSKSALDGLREIVELERQGLMEAIREAGGRINTGSVGRAMERYGKACARLAPFETPRLQSVELRGSVTEIKDPTETPEEIVWELAKILEPTLVIEHAPITDVDGAEERTVDPLDK
jgi:hypothetical protein